MTISRRTPHGAHGEDVHSLANVHSLATSVAGKEQTSHVAVRPIFRGRAMKRDWTIPKKEDVEVWLCLATYWVMLLVCMLWFFGKVPLIDWLFWINDNGRYRNEGLESVPLNPIYEIPHAHKIVGDRSDGYAILRQDIDSQLQEDPERSLRRMQELQQHSVGAYPTIPVDHNSDQIPKEAYDIYNCPQSPPPNYPFQWNILKLIENWNPEDTMVPDHIYNGLCIFDYERDYETAMVYRNTEVPFVVQNDPRIAATAERWNSPGYMQRLLKDVPHRTTRSDTNHFLYAVPPSPAGRHVRRRKSHTAPPGWKEPTKMMRMSYGEWLEHANVTDDKTTPDQPHWYFRLIGCGLTGPDGSCDKGSSEYLFDELPFFQPNPGGIYLREAEMQKGIHCRFGMRNTVADNHFDAGRNSIVVLGGSRRYMLASPNQCPKFALYPHGHPSARHSIVNWSAPDLERFPEFGEALANEVVLQSGDALYLPNNW